MNLKTWTVGSFVLAGLLAIALPSQAQQQRKLTVWWVKGFYKAEDDALFEAIKKFEAKHKDIKIELSQYPIQDTIPKTVAALDSGSPPDVAYSDVYDFQVTAKWAYDGKLEDISSLIDQVRNSFEPSALATTFLYNNADKKRAYYAYPIKQRCTSSTGKTCWQKQASATKTSPPNGKITGTSGAPRFSPLTVKSQASAALAPVSPWVWTPAILSIRS